MELINKTWGMVIIIFSEYENKYLKKYILIN